MNFQNKQKVIALAIGIFASLTALAGSEEDAIALQVDSFRKAQLSANGDALTYLTAPELSYSHSDGRVEDRSTFVTNAISGKAPFLVLEYRNPSIRVVDNSAVVRFHWLAEQQVAATGLKSNTDLYILMVWQKQENNWKLLARSATKSELKNSN